MLETEQPRRGLPRRRRNQVYAGVTAIAVLLALVQRTAFAPFPERYDDTTLGVAVGAALVTLALWAFDRRP